MTKKEKKMKRKRGKSAPAAVPLIADVPETEHGDPLSEMLEPDTESDAPDTEPPEDPTPEEHGPRCCAGCRILVGERDDPIWHSTSDGLMCSECYGKWEKTRKEHDATLYWPEGTPLPEEVKPVQRRVVPCPRCRRIRMDDGGQSTVCTNSGKYVTWFRCKVCGWRWKLANAGAGPEPEPEPPQDRRQGDRRVGEDRREPVNRDE